MQLLFLIPLILGGQNATENAQAPASREQDADVQAGFEAVRELRGLQSAAEAEEQALRVIEQDLGGLLVVELHQGARDELRRGGDGGD